MEKVVIIGGRGNGTVIASAIEDCKLQGKDFEFLGFLNDNEVEINGYPVVGKIRNNDWIALPKEVKFIYAMSNIKQASERHNLLKSLNIPDDRFTNIIHPSAVVSTKSKLGIGVVLMPYVLISPDVVLGNHTQMYAQSFIGHDSITEEMVFVGNNASVGGRVTLKNGSHIGSNSSVLERLTVGEYSIIGLGSVVLKDVKPGEVVVGNPGKVIKTIH